MTDEEIVAQEAEALVEEFNKLFTGKRYGSILMAATSAAVIAAKGVGMSKLEAQKYMIGAWDRHDREGPHVEVVI